MIPEIISRAACLRELASNPKSFSNSFINQEARTPKEPRKGITEIEGKAAR